MTQVQNQKPNDEKIWYVNITKPIIFPLVKQRLAFLPIESSEVNLSDIVKQIQIISFNEMYLEFNVIQHWLFCWSLEIHNETCHYNSDWYKTLFRCLSKPLWSDVIMPTYYVKFLIPIISSVCQNDLNIGYILHFTHVKHEYELGNYDQSNTE